MIKKVKLVIDCRMINMSGIGTYLKNIIPGLVNSGKYQITCLGYEEVKSFSWIGQVRFVSMRSRILSIAEQLELVMKVSRCDIFWAPNWNLPVILPVRAKKIIVTIHDVYHLANPDHFSVIQLKSMAFYMKRISGMAHRVITVSAFSKSEIVKYTPVKSERIAVIPLAVDENFNKGYTPEKIPGRYILYVGNVKPHKNLKLSLAAFAQLENSDLRFYIVGRKEGFITADETLQQLFEQLQDRVIFTGLVTDNALKNYYANASLFLFPSLYEGFGLPILEAMKFNLPIIASDKASIPEVAGNLVTYFDANSETDLVSKLKFFFGREAVPEANYAAHLQCFSWDHTVARHMEIFDQAIT